MDIVIKKGGRYVPPFLIFIWDYVHNSPKFLFVFRKKLHILEKNIGKVMSEVGLNENISIGKRVFHIQTSTSINNGYIKAEIFEKGRLLSIMYKNFEKRGENVGPGNRIKNHVEDFHKNIINNISVVFSISKRIIGLKNKYAHLYIGIVFYFLNLINEAEEHLSYVISLDKSNQIAYKYLIKIALKENNIEQAVLYKDELRKLKKTFADIHNIIGLVEYYSGNLIEAIQCFKKATAQNENYFEAYVNLMIVFIKSYAKVESSISSEEHTRKFKFLSGLYQKMEKALEENHRKNRLMEINIKPIGEEIARKNYERALHYLKKIHFNFFKEVDNYRILGYEIYLRIKYDLENLSNEEIASYEEKLKKTLKNHPEYADLWNVLGLIYIVHTRNLFKVSLDNFDKALQLNNSFKIARKNKLLVQNDGKELNTALLRMLK